MSALALSGITVLEIGHGVAGPYATRLLADLGAEVYKLEKPGDGDFVRSSGPVLFEALNWGKRSIELDVSDAASRTRLDELLLAADVVVTCLRPRTLAQWALLPDDLLAVNARLAAVAVTSFGLSGPKADYEASDLVLNAASGIMSISGVQGRAPIKHGWNTSQFAAGLNAAYVALAGYWTAARTGHGVAVDLSIRDCLTSELVMNNAFHSFCHLVQGCPPESSDPLDGNPLEAAKGYVSLQTSTRIPVSRLSGLFGDDTFSRPEFQDQQDRIERADELRAALERHLSTTSASELFQRASGEGYLSGFVQGVDELLECPHLAERSVFRELDGDSPLGRRWVVPASVVAMSRSPRTLGAPAPRLGEHNEWRPQPSASTRSGGLGPFSGEGSRPLAGLRVLDLSTVFAVPYLGALLADFGAEVIKVESTVRPDQTRTDWGGYFGNDPGDEPWNRGATFHVVNRGKKSVAMNLASDEGGALLRRLVESSDVLLENFTPRVMRSWGMTFDELATLNPRLVMLSNTGYGATGPWSSFKAQGTTLEATMGLMGVTGYHDGPPMRAGQSTPDFYACWAGLMAVFAALIDRERTGQGQHIDLAMYQLGASVLTDAVIDYQATGTVPGRLGARDVGAFLSGVYRTTDGWLAVSIDQARGQPLGELLGGDGMRGIDADDPASLEKALRAWAGGRTASEAERRLQEAAIAASKVMDADDLARDDQLEARGFYESVRIRRMDEERRMIGRPFVWRSSAASVGIAADAPDYGEHNDYVTGELLGLAASEQTALHERGVLGRRPQGFPEARSIDVEAAVAAGLFRPTSEVRPSP